MLFRSDQTDTQAKANCEGGYHGAGSKAIDFLVPNGTPVYAAGPGTATGRNGCPNVRLDSCYRGAGNYVDIVDETTGRVSRYFHLSEVIVFSGKVVRGQLIGKSGRSGHTVGTDPLGFYHLHYQEEAPRGTLVNPGPMTACVIKFVTPNLWRWSTRTYADSGAWPSVKYNETLHNDRIPESGVCSPAGTHSL